MHINYANTQMIDWDNVQSFLEVVRSGSVSRAADKLGVNQTTVSRRIAALEKSLATHLFERSGKQWLVTSVGEKLVKNAEVMADEANAIQRLAMSESQDLSGKLTITVANVCTQYLLMPVVQKFLQRYPGIELEIIATHDELNLSAREADIALRTTDEPPENLIGKRIGQLGYAVYGTPELLARIKAQDSLTDIPCISWVSGRNKRAEWIERNFPNTQCIYKTTELGLMQTMVVKGIGIAQMPCVFCDDDSRLVKIPVEFVEPGWGLWVLSHVDLRTTARVRIFREFLIKELEKNIKSIEGK